MATETKSNIVNGYIIKKGAKYYEVLASGVTHCFTSMAHARDYVKKYFPPKN